MESSADNIDLGGGSFSHSQIASTLSRKIQQLIILPTERCNFRCTYCYEDFLIGKMKDPIQASIERYLDRRIPELATLSFHWFGGEPLLAREVVLRLSSYASRLCNEYGVALSGAMTTNASVLDRALFEELLSYDQRFFQITLDGWRDGHDAVRRLANGRGTFERIWANLVATKDSAESFNILIRIHVRRDNYQSLEMLVDNIASAFGSDPRYALDFEHLRNLGGEGGKSVDRPLSVTEMRKIEAELRARYEAAVASLAIAAEPRQQQKASVSDIGEVKAPAGPDAEPYICYAAKPNSLLIRADGRIGKCTVAFSDERNTIGRINPDGTLTIDNGLLRPWLRGLSDLDPKALECPLSGMALAMNAPAQEAGIRP